MREIYRVFLCAMIILLVLPRATLGMEPTPTQSELAKRVVKKIIKNYPKSKSGKKLRANLAAIINNLGTTDTSSRVELDSEGCKICFSEYEDNLGKALSCGCAFHVSCTREYLETALNNRNFKELTRCPSCRAPLSADEIASFLDEDSLAALETLFLRNNKYVAVCARCEGGMAVKPKRKSAAAQCLNCDYRFCFSCEMPPHKNVSCEEAARPRDRFDFLVEVIGNDSSYMSKCRVCKYCHNIVDKLSGCNDMVCGNNSRDKTQIASINGCGALLNWASLNSLSDHMQQTYPEWSCVNWALLNPDYQFSDPDEVFMLVSEREQGANLINGSLKNVQLRKMVADGLDCTSLRGEKLLFESCNLEQVIFFRATLKNVRFSRKTNLQGTCFNNARLYDCHFDKAVVLGDAEFAGTIFAGTVITSKKHLFAILNGGGILAGLVFDGLKLTQADIDELDLSGVDFRNMDLTNLELSRVTLGNNTFVGCQISAQQYAQAHEQGNRDFHSVQFVGGTGFENLSFKSVNVDEADFRETQGLTKRQLMRAINWQTASYNRETLKLFGAVEKIKIRSKRRRARR